MTQYDDTNRGALFKNDKKATDNHPDYRGSINVGGQEFWISSWLKTAKSGQKFMSLSVTPKEDQPAAVQQPVQDAPADSDIPF